MSSGSVARRGGGAYGTALAAVQNLQLVQVMQSQIADSAVGAGAAQHSSKSRRVLTTNREIVDHDRGSVKHPATPQRPAGYDRVDLGPGSSVGVSAFMPNCEHNHVSGKVRQAEVVKEDSKRCAVVGEAS